MTTQYTGLLGLALPVQGELAGSWGDVVNNALTKYVDISVAGTQIISGSQTAVTLSTTNGGDVTDNISQVGSAGATGSNQYMVIRCTGNPASLLTISIDPTPTAAVNYSKMYVVINSTSTNQSVKVIGPTGSGVTIAANTQGIVVWNGSDFLNVTNSAVVQSISFGSTGLTPSTATNGAVTVAGTLGVANGGTGVATLTGLVKGNGTSAFSAAVSGTDYAPATTGTAILKGNGSGGFSNAVSSTDYAPPTSGTSILYGNGTGGFSNVTVGSGLSFAGGTLTSTSSGGTVSSVDATVPAFLSVSGVPITTSGTIAITYSGTALPVANGGTGATSAGIGTFNNITGYTTAGATGLTSSNLVFSTNPVLTNPTVTNYVETLYAANTGASVSVSLANGTVQQLTLNSASVTITMPTASSGKSFVIMLKQDATGGRSVTWSTVVWPSGTAPTITTTASKQDIYSFFSDGTNWYGVTIGQNY